MKLSDSDNEVLIVGGGPVGMLMALELNLFGIIPRIIAKHPRSSPHSKASIIWPRTLELLARTGVASEIINNGHYFDQMNYYSDKKVIGNIRFDKLKLTHYRFGITIPQWKTEQALEMVLNQRGIFIEYDCDFIDGADHAAGVDVSIRHAGGNIEHSTVRWLIGADGYGSKVREIFGFSFDGFSMKTRLAITDTQIVGEATSREVGYYLHRTGNMVLAPIGDGLFRVGASVPEDYDGKIDRDFFNKLLAVRVPGNKSLGEMNFSGVFNAHVRSASTYRKQHVFLVGDAAHAMSPSGAQGMNSGFQDAVNLAWKLAGVLKQHYPEVLLDSYSSERIDGIRRISNLSTFLAKISLYRNPAAIYCRDMAFRLSSKTGILDKYFTPRIAQIDIPMAPLAAGKTCLEVGRRIPLEWISRDISPQLNPVQHTLLFWPGDHYIHSEWRGFIEKAVQAIKAASVINLSGKAPGLLKDLLPSSPLCVIVRPDGYISGMVSININHHPMPAIFASINQQLSLT